VSCLLLGIDRRKCPSPRDASPDAVFGLFRAQEGKQLLQRGGATKELEDTNGDPKMTTKPEMIYGDEMILDTFLNALGTITSPTAQFLVDGVLYTPTDLAKKIQDERQPYKDVRNLDGNLKGARDVLKAKKKDIHAFVNALHVGAKAYVGSNVSEIAKFGFKPDKKPEPLSAEKQKERVDKARMTRKLRHTMGKRQKADIKAGDIPPPPPPPPAAPDANSTPGTTNTTPGTTK
jgi:hypothetical protein